MDALTVYLVLLGRFLPFHYFLFGAVRIRPGVTKTNRGRGKGAMLMHILHMHMIADD
jgi:hypothetical protein